MPFSHAAAAKAVWAWLHIQLTPKVISSQQVDNILAILARVEIYKNSEKAKKEKMHFEGWNHVEIMAYLFQDEINYQYPFCLFYIIFYAQFRAV